MSLTSGSLSKRGALLRRASGSQSLLARFLRGILWLLLNDGASKGLQFLGLILAGRWLEKAEFGMLGAVLTTLALFQGSVSLGLSDATTKFVSQYRTSDTDRASAILIASRRLAWAAGIISAVALIAGAGLASQVMVGDASLVHPFQITALTIVFTLAATSTLAALVGHERFQAASTAGLFGGLTTFVGVVAGSLVGGVIGATLGLMIGAAVTAIVAWRSAGALRTDAGKGQPLVGPALRQLMAFALPGVLAALMANLAIWLSNILVVRYTDVASLGLLTAVSQIRAALLLLPMVMVRVTLPFLSNAIGSGAKDNFDTVERLTTRLTIISMMPLCGFFMFTPELLLGLFGNRYSDGGPLLIWILTTVMIQSSGISAGPALQAANRVWVGFWINVSFLGLYVGSSFLLLPRYGVIGSGMAITFAYAILASAGWVALYVFKLCSARRMLQVMAQLLIALCMIPVITVVPPSFHNLAAAITVPIMVMTGLILTDFRWKRLKQAPAPATRTATGTGRKM